MALDPQLQVMIDQLGAASLPPLSTQTPEEARLTMVGLGSLAQRPPGVTSRDLTIPGPAGDLPARLYRPQDVAGTLPGLVYLHGGGFVLGSIETHDAPCASLALGGECVVVSVEYRLAPEHPFPAALDDAAAATAWVAAHGADLGVDPARLGVGGDSAGGNLAAVLAIRARDRGTPPLACQLLVYPWVDVACERGSMQANAEGFLLERASLDWFRSQAFGDPARYRDPEVSPLRAADLSHLPPAIVATAGYDPLCDQGDEYARRLAEAGVPVEHLRYETLVHGFLHLTSVTDAARTATEEIAAALAKLLRA